MPKREHFGQIDTLHDYIMMHNLNDTVIFFCGAVSVASWRKYCLLGAIFSCVVIHETTDRVYDPELVWDISIGFVDNKNITKSNFSFKRFYWENDTCSCR